MEKGKLKEEKKYLSIVLIPHSSDKVKVLRFSAANTKLTIISAAVLIFIICLSLFIFNIINENQKLKQSVTTLSNLNIEQKNLLSEKMSEISGLKEKETSLNDKIAEYVRKFREMTENYLSNKTNRSGDTNDPNFIKDANELKKLLDDIEKENTSNTTVPVDLSETEIKLKKYLDNIPTLWPASGRISSPFGARADPFHLGKKIHEGIDIAADYGQPIRAAANGTVIYSGYYGGYGNAIIIDHGHEITTIYGHTSKLIAKKGQEVKKGDIIAEVGSTGRSTGSHLHFEVRINDTPVDPFKYLDSK